ncbi:MAG: hypothetical protein IIA70_01625 [Proteobacteria bacterium]|nr:hypothetical protein [Pseudomonadota bacterium]
MNRNFHRIFNYPEQKNDYNQKEKCEALSTPIAVYPNKINSRMIFQNALFTYHGGKLGGITGKNHSLPKPYSLIKLNSKEIIGRTNQMIMRAYEIPYDFKELIRNDLMNLRIHKGSLFRDIGSQVEYVEQISKLH